jgi:hypothetical protein
VDGGRLQRAGQAASKGVVDAATSFSSVVRSAALFVTGVILRGHRAG